MSQSFDADANSRLCHLFAQKCVGWYYRGEAAYLQAYETMIDELVELYNPRTIAINTGAISVPPNFVDALTPILVPYNKANKHLPFALFERCLQDHGLVYDPRAAAPPIAPLPAPPAQPTRPTARARAPASTVSGGPPPAGPSNPAPIPQGKGSRPNPTTKTKAGPASKASAGRPEVVITRPAEGSRKRKAPSDLEDPPPQRKSRGRKPSDNDNYQEPEDEQEQQEGRDAAPPPRAKRARRVSSKATVATEDEEEAVEHSGLRLVHRPHEGVRKVGAGWYDNGLPDPPQKPRAPAGGQGVKKGPPAGGSGTKKASAARQAPPAEDDDDDVIVVDTPVQATCHTSKGKVEPKAKSTPKAPEEEHQEELKEEGSENDDPAVYDPTLPPLEQARQLKRLLADKQAKNDLKTFTVFDSCQACEQKKKKCEFSLGPIRQSNNGHKAACNYCQKQRKRCEPAHGTFSLHTKLGDYKFPVEPPAGDDPTLPAPGIKGEDTNAQTVGDLLLTLLKETRLATDRVSAMERIMEERYHPGTMEYHPPPFDIEALNNTVQSLVAALATPPPAVPPSALSDILARLTSLEAAVRTSTTAPAPAAPAAPSLPPLFMFKGGDEVPQTPPAERDNSPPPPNTPSPRGHTQTPPHSPIAEPVATPRPLHIIEPITTVTSTPRTRRFVSPPPVRPSVSPSPATIPEEETGVPDEDVEMGQDGQVSNIFDQDAQGDDEDETDARPTTPSAGRHSPRSPAEGSLHEELNDGDGASETQGGDNDDDDLSSAPLTPVPSDSPVAPSKTQEEDGEDMDIGSPAEDEEPPPPSDPRNKLRSTKRAVSIEAGGKAMGGRQRRSGENDGSGPSGGGKRPPGNKKIRT